MEQTFSVAGRRVVVVGAARSGIAAAELLVRRGARVVLTETRDAFDAAARVRDQGVELELGGHRRDTLAAADLLVVSPGVPLEQPVFDVVRERGIETIGELELAWRWLRGRVIAITGTKGKSTTTTVIGRMVSAAGHHTLVGGNIGVPLSEQVDQSTPDTIHVVEVSSFQLETTTTFRPWIALWLNFSADHLDRHPSVDAYAAAKARIFANQQQDDWAVLNVEDAVVMQHAAAARARRILFAPSRGVDDPRLRRASDGQGFAVDGDWIVRRTSTAIEQLVPVSAVELTGRHMLGNVVAAVAVASAAGMPPESMVEGLREFHGLEHVMEPVGYVGGVRFVNDSKATNVEAARRSILSFDRNVVAVIGGRFKGGDLRELAGPLATRGRAVVAIGESAYQVYDALSSTLYVTFASSMREAVERAYRAAQPDGVVLLAPACSSFDWFRDYAERGRAFKEEVGRLRESER